MIKRVVILLSAVASIYFVIIYDSYASDALDYKKDQIINMIEALSNIEYKAKIETTLYNVEKNNDLPKNAPQILRNSIRIVEYKVFSGKYKFELTELSPETSPKKSILYAFDGANSMTHNKIDGLLSVKTGPHTNTPDFWLWHCLAWPLEFLRKRDSDNRAQPMVWGVTTQFGKDLFFQPIAKAAKLADDEGSQAIYEFYGSKDPYYLEDCHYKVYFSMQSPIPLKVEQIQSKTGWTISSVECSDFMSLLQAKETDNFSKLSVPSTIKQRIFNSEGKVVRDSLATIGKIQIISAADDEIFTVDPGDTSVRNIFDVDKRVYIQGIR